jgi:phage-related protein
LAGPIKISFLADVGKAQKDIKAVGDETEKAGKNVESSGGRMGKGFDAVGKAAMGVNNAIDLTSSALSGIDQIQNSARNEANRLARAQQDVEQAMADGEQAAIDLKQATEDLKQAQIDGSQAAVDIEQAQIDAKQASLDTAEAQKTYTEAVKKHGKNSAEARQAEIDLLQAKSDQKQATVDLTQAQADQRQAQLDASQAQNDGKQAAIDAKDATLNLADAQREVNPSTIQQTLKVFEQWAPIVGLLVTTIPVASSATKVWTGIQAAFNFVMAANPIGLVILAIAALVAGIVIAYKRSETFRNIVNAVGGALRTAGVAVWNFIKTVGSAIGQLPGKIASVFNGAKNMLAGAGRAIVQGFLGGITGAWHWVTDKVSSLVNLIPGPVRRILGIASPSKVFAKIGGQVGAGMAQGIADSQADVARATEGLVQATTGAAGSVSGTVSVAPSSTPAWAQRLMDLLDGGITLTLDSSGHRGDDALLELIRDRVTAKGGKGTVLGIRA